MAELIWKIKGEGDTIGGVVSCVIKGCPIGLGQPVFGKLHAALGNAMLSINAVKGFSYGQGFDSMELKGSEQNDVFYNNNGRVETKVIIPRNTRRHQQRTRHLLPCGIQTSCHNSDGATYCKYQRHRHDHESQRTS